SPAGRVVWRQGRWRVAAHLGGRDPRRAGALLPAPQRRALRPAARAPLRRRGHAVSADAILLRDLGRWCDTTLASPRLLVGLQLLRPRRDGVLHEREVWMVVGMRALDGRRLAWRLRSLDRPHAEEE